MFDDQIAGQNLCGPPESIDTLYPLIYSFGVNRAGAIFQASQAIYNADATFANAGLPHRFYKLVTERTVLQFLEERSHVRWPYANSPYKLLRKSPGKRSDGMPKNRI